MARFRGTLSLSDWLVGCWLPLVVVGGCQPSSDSEVVVYTALDRQFSEPLFEQFTQQTGIRVRAKYDTEANKTVGLTNLIMNEAVRPRCDVFWNNEILNTLRLQQQDLLRAYRSPRTADYAAEFRDPDGHWYGFAARARVLLVNTELLGDSPPPSSIHALIDPRWKGQVGVAKPLFGTTATHAACLFAVWGPERAKAYFRQLQEQAQILPGNRQVAQAVAGKQLVFGLTDTDDAMLEIERGMPVQIVYPDQQPDGLGTLLIPNTLALIRGGPHPSAAEQLLDFLLAPENEQRLADGPSAQIPLNRQASPSARVATPPTMRPMRVDFAAAAEQWETAAEFLRDLFASTP